MKDGNILTYLKALELLRDGDQAFSRLWIGTMVDGDVDIEIVPIGGKKSMKSTPFKFAITTIPEGKGGEKSEGKGSNSTAAADAEEDSSESSSSSSPSPYDSLTKILSLQPSSYAVRIDGVDAFGYGVSSGEEEEANENFDIFKGIADQQEAANARNGNDDLKDGGRGKDKQRHPGDVQSPVPRLSPLLSTVIVPNYTIYSPLSSPSALYSSFGPLSQSYSHRYQFLKVWQLAAKTALERIYDVDVGGKSDRSSSSSSSGSSYKGGSNNNNNNDDSSTPPPAKKSTTAAMFMSTIGGGPKIAKVVVTGDEGVYRFKNYRDMIGRKEFMRGG